MVNLYHVMLGYDVTTVLTSFPWYKIRCVNILHHGFYTMADKFENLSDEKVIVKLLN